MKIKRFKHIKNGIFMVWKNMKIYVFLSVTIVMSFTALLLFLIFSDSCIFNKYKEILHTSPYICIATCSADDEKEEKIFRILSEKLSESKETYYYIYEKQSILLEHITRSQRLTGMLRVVPRYCWGYYYTPTRRFEQENGEKRIALSKGQAIVSREFLSLLDEECKEIKYIDIPIRFYDGTIEFNRFEIVGVCNSELLTPIFNDKDGELNGCIDIFVSTDNFTVKKIDSLDKEMLIYSRNMEKVGGWLEQFGLSNSTSYIEKNLADEEMRNNIYIKSAIAIALLLLLGINLYSSFNNALDERKFEIGVRRAIGASAKEIILQFFVEGLVIMIANLMISIMCTIEVLSLYRIIRFFICHEHWIIYINRYSIAIFLCCCIFLSLIYSIIFAVSSLRVEVIHYLKNE